jgi:hypothetical protein
MLGIFEILLGEELGKELIFLEEPIQGRIVGAKIRTEEEEVCERR